MWLDWTELETAGRANIPWQKQQQQEMQIADAEEWWCEDGRKGELVNLRLPPPDWPRAGNAGINQRGSARKGQEPSSLPRRAYCGWNVTQNTWPTARVAPQAI
jgi:hypothetical protein